MGVSNTTDQEQAGGAKRQQRKAAGESDRQQQQGLYGADEVGFQAAGSAIKSIVAMSLGAGKHRRVRRTSQTATCIACMHLYYS